MTHRAIAFVLLLPLAAAAQTPTPAPIADVSLYSTLGTIVFAGDETKTPVVGMRLIVDAQIARGLRAFGRAEFSRQSDGGAIDAGTAVLSFDTGELYVGAYFGRGAVAIEVFAGQAYALSDRSLLRDADPWIGGGGFRLRIAGGSIFLGGGIHRATGTGGRGLTSLLLPVKGNTSFYVDAAAGSEKRQRVVRSGVAVRF